jgi:hypothetical protein
MKSLVFISTLFILVGAASTEAAIQYLPQDQIFPHKKITLQVRKLGARDVIKDMLDQAPIGYILPESLTNDLKVSVNAHNVEWSYVFKLVLDRAGYVYYVSPQGLLTLTPKSE